MTTWMTETMTPLGKEMLTLTVREWVSTLPPTPDSRLLSWETLLSRLSELLEEVGLTEVTEEEVMNEVHEHLTTEMLNDLNRHHH